uniref:ribosomal protein L35 n=1 Tax=Chroothece richteriana TaxID=101928 RepID=UPI001FCDF9A9|nr:ribosomal protein L35 [Chroothece richteriana]UNJ14210.1 ribosomal protein L35 [Chroothece richteriana]
MPKIKTCRAMAKRFRATRTNKILRRKAGKSHLLEKKAINRKRNLRQRTSVDPRDIKNFINKVPYIF